MRCLPHISWAVFHRVPRTCSLATCPQMSDGKDEQREIQFWVDVEAEQHHLINERRSAQQYREPQSSRLSTACWKNPSGPGTSLASRMGWRRAARCRRWRPAQGRR